MSGLTVGARPTDLVPGDPGELDRLVARCRTVAEGLGGAATRLRAVDAGEWVGPAGDAFRAVVDVEPGRYDDAAAAFAATGSAVRGYVAVLRDAQGSARTAVTIYEQAATTTSSWSRTVDSYDAKVRDAQDTEHPQRVVDGLTRPPSYDPGADDRRRAETLLADARQRVAGAGAGAARTIGAAWAHAPREPHWWEKAGHFVAEIGRGAWEATAGLLEFAWSVSQVRMLVDPVGWSRDMEALGEGVVYGVAHPVELGKVLLDWDTWQESPGRAIGHLVPDLLITLATAGGGAAARGARGVEAIDEVAAVADVATTYQRLDRLGESGERLTYLQRARNVLGGERLPEPNLGHDSPAGMAAAWQGKSPYDGTDRWFNARLSAGDEIGAGSLSFMPDKPFTGFAVPSEVLDDVSTDARRLYEGVQVQPYGGSYRDEVTRFRVTGDADVAVSYALDNPQFGAGGLRQVYVPDMARLVDDGVLEIIERRPMDNLDARLGALVAP